MKIELLLRTGIKTEGVLLGPKRAAYLDEGVLVIEPVFQDGAIYKADVKGNVIEMPIRDMSIMNRINEMSALDLIAACC